MPCVFRGWRVLLGLVWLAMCLMPARAQQVAAEIRSAVGVVFAQAGGGEVRVLQVGAKLSVGETVGTQKGAFAMLVFGDGSRVALRPESALTVRGFRYRPEDAKEDEMAVQLLQGWLRKVSGEIGKRNPRSFEMRVGDATIGIRGTDFAVRICDEACARERVEGGEGVLPQSRRLGQVVATTTPLRRQRDEVVDRAAAGAMLMLGDVLATDDDQALVGLDDGTRIVLAPRSVLGLRSIEDDLGRRAVRLDLMQGALRVAAGPRASARLYGLLVNAGTTVGLRPDAALDARCEAPAAAQAYACSAATVLLRQGRGDVLTESGARPLNAGQPERLVEPGASNAPAPSAPTAPAAPSTPGLPSSSTPPDPPPGTPASPAPATSQQPLPPDRLRLAAVADAVPGGWAEGASDAIDPLDVPNEEGEQSPEAPPAPTPSPPPAPPPARPGAGPTDPLDIPVDSSRPPTVAEQPVAGVYVAVFEGLVSVSNRLGEVMVSVGRGAYVPLLPSAVPRALPASPLFMERDPELERSRLYPDMCVR